jgi:aldehyde:ferredoxin oxidoreductase
MVHFADIIYKKKATWDVDGKPYMPGFEDGKWDYHNYGQRTLDRSKFDEFKTRFYKLQGWDPGSGYPTKATLEKLGLGYVAVELEKNGKLGRS